MGNLLLHLFLIVVLLQRSLAQAQHKSSGPEVTLTSGTVRGHYTAVKGVEQQVEEYLGIPFAHPPTYWDCLRRQTACDGVDPWGRPGCRVVVVIQYHLSILGFLSTGDQHAPGNCRGFLDQIDGLQWVRGNITAFNGDPNSVTIFGQSAGGISVSMLVLSPLAEDLFHKAIAMSGVAPLEAHYASNPLAIAQMIANLSDCESSNSKKLVECIKGRSEEEILSAMKKASDAGVPVYVYAFQYSPLMHGRTRPVKADHYDDAWLFLGACFCTGHTVVT
ncbi:hypothetical protein KUCAC02_017248, partial [Chaenocephalus aceratus]